ncbi:conserved hypothetical protein [Xanthomonas citri pv. citri]|nr:conserved hypothetical protein [Xanthomonas citri pv. citri]CEH59349.1 conserved hypothetical protein [Xanthomonas citri pv. citri]
MAGFSPPVTGRCAAALALSPNRPQRQDIGAAVACPSPPSFPRPRQLRFSLLAPQPE